MEAIELVAANIQEAKELAASKLGVSTDEVTVTVIEETKGLFGKPGKIKVRAEIVKGKAKPKAAKPVKEVAAPEPTPIDAVEAELEAPAKTARPTRTPRAKVVKEEAAVTAPGEVSGAEDANPSTEDVRPPAVASEEDAAHVVGILNSLLEKADLRADATLSNLNGRYINVSIDGKDVGYLVGRRGEVLNALQYLTNVIVSRTMQSGVRVTLDGDNYRRRREEALTQLATEIATQVKERGEEAVLDALPAFERRVVHQALIDFEGVTSYSEGEEPNRRVVIGPS